MNREDYLKQLDKYLRKLPKEDYENAMNYFTEYFDEAGEEGEQGVIEELGTPKEAAAELLKNLLDRKTGEDDQNAEQEDDFDDEADSGTGKGKKKGSILWIACLAILAAPIGAPLAFALLALIFAATLVIAVGILCVFIFSISAVLISAKMMLCGIAAIPFSISGTLLLLGIGLLGIGCSVLAGLLAVAICKVITKCFIRFSRRLAEGKKKEE